MSWTSGKQDELEKLRHHFIYSAILQIVQLSCKSYNLILLVDNVINFVFYDPQEKLHPNSFIFICANHKHERNLQILFFVFNFKRFINTINSDNIF